MFSTFTSGEKGGGFQGSDELRGLGKLRSAGDVVKTTADQC